MAVVMRVGCPVRHCSPKKLSGAECRRWPLSLFRNHGELDLAFLYVEDGIGRLALCIENTFLFQL